jgi:hypothetical protein
LLAHVDKLAVLKDGALEAFGPVTQVDPKLRPMRSVTSAPSQGGVSVRAGGVTGSSPSAPAQAAAIAAVPAS